MKFVWFFWRQGEVGCCYRSLFLKRDMYVPLNNEAENLFFGFVCCCENQKTINTLVWFWPMFYCGLATNQMQHKLREKWINKFFRVVTKPQFHCFSFTIFALALCYFHVNFTFFICENVNAGQSTEEPTSCMKIDYPLSTCQ